MQRLSFFLFVIAVGLFFASLDTHAGVVFVGKTPVVTGAVTPAPANETATPRGATVCLWRVPGREDLVYVNLYSLRSMTTSGSSHRGYRTTVSVIGDYWVIDIPPGADITIHTSAIIKRLKECQTGEVLP